MQFGYKHDDLLKHRGYFDGLLSVLFDFWLKCKLRKGKKEEVSEGD